MGRLRLISRLAARDLRRRPAEAALLLLVIVAATGTLALGLALRGLTNGPYERTREATSGPDVVAVAWPAEDGTPGGQGPGAVGPERDGPEGGGPAGEPGPFDLAGLEALADAHGVVAHSGPYPITMVTLGADGRGAPVQAIGRDPEPAAVDQPALTAGRWLDGPGGVVVDAAFAEARGIDVGDTVTLGSRSFAVVGVAVTAAMPPHPFQFCLTPSCAPDAGTVWLTRTDAEVLDVRADTLAYALNLQLADPADAPAFVDQHLVLRDEIVPPTSGPPDPIGMSWQDIRDGTDERLRHQRRALLTGSWLLGLLAVASVAVLVGGRMADQTRRVGLLKAVGGTPGLAAAVLLAEHAAVALVAAVVGLGAAWVAAPALTDAGAGLVGQVGTPAFRPATVGLVTATALGIAAAATFVPALRAARTSTVRALTDSAHPPRRTAWLIALSARLPVSLLWGLRITGRRPRRVLLNAASVFVTVSGIVAVLGAHADLESNQIDLDRAGVDRLNQVLVAVTVALVVLAAVNAIFVSWATTLDARHAAALARSLGATPYQVSSGLAAAQVLPALAGTLAGIPGGIGLLAVVDPDRDTPVPPSWQLLLVVVSAGLLVAALTAVPARLGARRSVAATLRSEHT